MKATRRILCALLAVVLLCGTALAATGFNAKLTIDRTTDGVITVGVESSPILESETPTLSIPCDFAAATVTGPDGVELECTVENGQISFTVAKGGTYTITEKETPPADDDNTDPVVPTPPPYDPPVITPPTAPKDEPVVNPFTDVKEGAYYYDAVLWAVENGITGGMTPTAFGPDVTCTRAQVVTFLWRALGCPEPVGTANAFSDVKAGTYYSKAVQWAIENGITAGTGDGSTFSPDAPCTRAQVVTFLWRAMDKPEANTSASFTDVKSGDYYTAAVQWAVENTITAGTGDGSTFSPANDCARAQVVTFLWRCLAK